MGVAHVRELEVHVGAAVVLVLIDRFLSHTRKRDDRESKGERGRNHKWTGTSSEDYLSSVL